MRRWAPLPLALILLAPTLAGCFGPPATPQADVVATFYPLRFFASQIAGENLSVTSLVPEGTEPHDWEPRPADVTALAKAKVFLYNGAGFEPWAASLVERSGNTGLRIVDASRYADPMPAVEEEAEGHAENATEEEHEEHEGGLDPHFWLDPARSRAVVTAITGAIRDADPVNGPYYAERSDALIENLTRLDQEYQGGLRDCTKREILATHDAFSYLAARYNFTVHSLSGLSPEAQPSAKKMQELVDLARERGLKHVFFETLVSRELAEAIAREVGAETLVLNPIEGLTPDQAAAGEDYFSLMRANLANLREAMACR